MSKVKWSKVSRGDVIEAGGIAWTVEKIKAKGKKAKVTIRNGSRVAESKVELTDKVKLATTAPAPAKSRPPKRQAVKPPAPAHGDPWETQQDRIERKMDEILGARLVGEATDPSAGYYCPPVDLTTIQTHMLIYHGDLPDEEPTKLMQMHAKEHEEAKEHGLQFKLNHWHTEKRPTSGKKSKKKGKRS